MGGRRERRYYITRPARSRCEGGRNITQGPTHARTHCSVTHNLVNTHTHASERGHGRKRWEGSMSPILPSPEGGGRGDAEQNCLSCQSTIDNSRTQQSEARAVKNGTYGFGGRLSGGACTAANMDAPLSGSASTLRFHCFHSCKRVCVCLGGGGIGLGLVRSISTKASSATFAHRVIASLQKANPQADKAL